MGTVAKSEQLQRMLQDPEFQKAWDTFNDELAKFLDLLKQGVLPTGQAVGKAAHGVLTVRSVRPV